MIASVSVSILIESQWNLNQAKEILKEVLTDINRITVEFKQGCGKRDIENPLYINRITVEFKWCFCDIINLWWLLILIESQWNLNASPFGLNFLISTILIESQWNLNYTPAQEIDNILSILIESQ